MPDLFGKDSVFDFDKTNKHWIKQAFLLREPEIIYKVIAGRAVHATYERIGYFAHIPSKEEVYELVKGAQKCKNPCNNLIQMFFESTFKLERTTSFVALVTSDFSFLEGEIRDSQGLKIKEEDYWNFLNLVTSPDSQATRFVYMGKEYMVGSARLNLNRTALHVETRKDASKFLNIFPSFNIFHNNLAQAIEILHCIDHSVQILEEAEFKEESPPKYDIHGGRGVGVIEAPRGTLYHMIELDNHGRVTHANFVIPTAQNQIKMEEDMKMLIPQILDRSKYEVEHELEKVVRAYDPCMTVLVIF